MTTIPVSGVTLHNRHTGEVLNVRSVRRKGQVSTAGPPGRPPLFYLAHVALRHRRTQAVLVMPPPIQAVLFRVVVAMGTVLGKYRGTRWPGCPSRIREVPEETA